MYANVRYLDVLPNIPSRFDPLIYEIITDFVSIETKTHDIIGVSFILINPPDRRPYYYRNGSMLHYEGNVFFAGNIKRSMEIFYSINWDWDECIILDKKK